MPPKVGSGLAIDVGNGWVENVAWSPDGKWLAASCSRQVHAYGADGVKIWRSHDHPSTVSAISWSGTEELATACYGRVSFFDAFTGKLRQKLEWMGSLVSMVLSPDGDIVVCGSQDNLGALLASLHRAGLDDVGISREAVGLGLR